MLITNFWYILAAISPAFNYILCFQQDLFPEPKKIVLKPIFGASIVLVLDLIIGDVDNYAKNLRGETFHFFDNFVRAAFLEEFFKMIVIIFCTRKDEFDEPMDGLVYGVAASLGLLRLKILIMFFITLKNPSQW